MIVFLWDLGEVENIKFFLLHCTNHNDSRENLFKLRKAIYCHSLKFC